MAEMGRGLERALDLLVERRADALRPDEDGRDPLWRRLVEAPEGELREANATIWRMPHLNLTTLLDRASLRSPASRQRV